MRTNDSFDCIVVGGGLVGLSATLALEQAGFRVALVDRATQAQAKARVGGDWDSRIYAISPGNMDWCRSLGIEKHLDEARIQPVSAMQVYGDTHGQLHFKQTEGLASVHAPDVSYILENDNLMLALQKTLLERSCPRFYATPSSLTVSPEQACLTLTTGERLSAKLVLGADGAQSWLRQWMGVASQYHDYQQVGVVANFSISGAHDNTATQWFLGESILACLPLPSCHISMVWSVPSQQVEELMSLPLESLSQRVSETSQHRYGTLSCVTPPQAFPLKRVTLDNTVANRVALLGDAAHIVHPLAGQGVNLGFRDVAGLLKHLTARKAFEDIGDLMLLRRYARERKADVMAMMQVTHGLKYLFEHPSKSAAFVRNAGLTLLDRVPIIKKRLVKQATL